MELNTQFDQAVSDSKNLTKRPDNDSLLKLYALYKQATAGDVSGERPGGFDFKAIAKFDAWSGEQGKTRETAMQEYIALVTQLKQEYL